MSADTGPAGYTFSIRPLNKSDSITDLTVMLHRAYAPLAAQGMRYFASHQSDADTLERATADGSQCFVACAGDRVVGTITLSSINHHEKVEWYLRDDVVFFQQYGVDPIEQGRGIGAALLEHAESVASEMGMSEIACDTSEHAADLIALYTRLGYRIVARHDWDVTNYASVILSKSLNNDP